MLFPAPGSPALNHGDRAAGGLRAQIASELLIERLADWGVDTVFGLPGDGINGIMEGLRRHSGRVKFFLVHHEEAAAFMATAYAKATGKLGVCLATSGPGAIHLLNGLYDAKLDHVPVLAITGMQETAVLGTGYQQEVHTDRLYADLAEYNLVIENPAQLPGVVDIAVRNALARRGRRPPRRSTFPARPGPDRRPRSRRAGAQRGREGRHPGRDRRAARPRGGAHGG